MSYPNVPENRLIIKMDDNPYNNIDLFNKFNMFLIDGYNVDPPSPKTYTVDIPGGNGKLDLTDFLLGDDCVYDDRKQEFTFYIVDIYDTVELEKIKTKVHNFLHGKDFDYIWTIDPEYTYHGRFTISDISHQKYANVDIAHQMKITIEGDPYKYKQKKSYTFSAMGGTIRNFESGRKAVQPTWKVNDWCRIIFNGIQYDLKQGSYVIPGITFKEGNNEVYISTYPVHKLSWGDLINGYEGHLNPITWGEFKNKKLFEWYKTGPGYIIFSRWIDVAETTWQTWMDKGVKWKDFIYRQDTDSPTIASVKHLKWNEWYDNLNPETDEHFTWGDLQPNGFVDETGIFGMRGKKYQKWEDMLYIKYEPIEIKDVDMEYEWGDL